MIKDCKVLINNDAVTVFDFDGVHVQVPSIKRKASIVRVLFDNNTYKVVDDDYVEKKPVKKNDETKKKATENVVNKFDSMVKDKKVDDIKK